MKNVARMIRIREERLGELNKELIKVRRLLSNNTIDLKNFIEDYPNYKKRESCYRASISIIEGQIDRVKKELNELYKERSWIDCKYYRYLDTNDISNIISKDGFIKATKL